jgi:IMP cyclohydrolase
MYRVSSRSFPNRTAVLGEAKVSIVPKPGFESDVQKNPYIAYNCVRVVCEGEVAVVSNGSHTDPIAEKMAMGLPARDAMTLSMLALDYEKDSYNTPRIAAVLDRVDGAGWLGVIREDGLEVRRMPLSPGRFFYVATYEENTIQESQSGGFEVRNAEEACAFILGQGIFAERENPVSAVAAVEQDEGYAFATADSRQD